MGKLIAPDNMAESGVVARRLICGLPFTAQVFCRALDGIRSGLADDAGVTGTELRALSRVATL